MHPKPKPFNPLLRLLRLALLTGGSGYVVIGAVLYFAQDSLIFAGSMYQGGPEAEFKDPPLMQRLKLTTQAGEPITALYAPTFGPTSRPSPQAPTLLWFYGNGMSLSHSLDEIRRFHDLGFTVVCADYPGYGLSGGRPSEAGCYRTADTLLEWVRSRPELAGSPIVAGGWSMGGAVAIELATREELAGLIALSTFSSMTDAATAQYPWLPVRTLIRHRFESERKLPAVRCPLLLGHGSEDLLAPLWMMERNRKAAAGPAQTFVIDGAGHNDFFSRGNAKIDRNVAEFRKKLTPR